ncbi:hypothetical protein [Streptomyces sp. NPDC058475]|uniref:hypothetical protein n=1 Tax=Streptomyces sp. NPDC058475 TaxID=3346518 RepID=UPI00366441F9
MTDEEIMLCPYPYYGMYATSRMFFPDAPERPVPKGPGPVATAGSPMGEAQAGTLGLAVDELAGRCLSADV